MARRFGPHDEVRLERVTEATWNMDDYADRTGYDPNFLGTDHPLPLPGAGSWVDDLVTLKEGVAAPSADRTEIAYTHFSVRMSRSRRLPLFSAVNIEGALSDRAVKRTDVWRRDPRIEPAVQNLKEGYGTSERGMFSRGHLTRREDPNWGDRAIAEQADADTFHATNIAPQRQGFNAGIWLSLESYVLDNAGREQARVSVITGPILRDDDPEYYNVRVPVDFFKVVAFRHGVTGELSTIAYRRSQLTYLPALQRERFVFGNFQDSQVSVRSIEVETGLDLDCYVAHDVMQGADPRLEISLTSVADLYLTR